MTMRMSLAVGDALWLIRNREDEICEVYRLPAGWLTEIAPTKEYPSGLYKVRPGENFEPGMEMPKALGNGFYVDRRECLTIEWPKVDAPKSTHWVFE